VAEAALRGLRGRRRLGALRIDSAEDAAAVALAARQLLGQIAIGSPGGNAMTPSQLADSLLTPLRDRCCVEAPGRCPLVDSSR
jgi:hypothetical protein